MELYNELTSFTKNNDIYTDDQSKAVFQEAAEAIVLLLAPIVPHMSHVLWNHLGKDGAVIDASWPVHDENALVQDSIQIVVQVNGKLRAKLEVSADISKEDMEATALNDENVKKFADGLTIRKVIVVPGKLVNVVAN